MQPEKQPLQPVEGSWDVEIGWREGTTDDERIEAGAFIEEASREANDGRENIPDCIRSITFRKI